MPTAVAPTEQVDVAEELAVRVSGLGKRYPLFTRRRSRLLALFGRTSSLEWKTALADVNLVAKRGEAVGIIGENGSGKSTLLRIIAGISAPSAGAVEAAEPVAAILDLGLGFHPEFTGRENAMLYGGLVGIAEAEMRARLPEILAFADLGEFIDQPLRTYSSGMAARLAFSVAANVDARVLVVDEALAVGDGAFQKKCVDRMVRLKEQGTTVLFCSHAMYLVAGFCERALWLRQGSVAAEGPARDVIYAYEDYLRRKERRAAEGPAPLPQETARAAVIETLTFEPADGRVRAGNAVTITVGIRRKTAGVPLHVALTLEDRDRRCLWGVATRWDGLPPLAGGERETVSLRLPRFPFARDELLLVAFLADETGLQVLDQVYLPTVVRPTSERWEAGLVDVPHEWDIQGG